MLELKLSRPLCINRDDFKGEIASLLLDLDSLSLADMRQIDRLERQILDVPTEGEGILGKNLSYSFQVAAGFVAAVKGTPGLTVADYPKIPLKDSFALARLTSFFWLKSDGAAEKISSDTTA